MEFSRSAVWEHRIIRTALVMIPVSHVIALQMIEKTKFAFFGIVKRSGKNGRLFTLPYKQNLQETKAGKELSSEILLPAKRQIDMHERGFCCDFHRSFHVQKCAYTK